MKRKYENEDITDRSASNMMPLYSHSYPSSSSHHHMHSVQPVQLFHNTHAHAVGGQKSFNSKEQPWSLTRASHTSRVKTSKYTRARTHTLTLTHARAHTHTHTHTLALSLSLSLSLSLPLSLSLTHTHSLTFAYTPTHPHTHTLTHTNSLSHSLTHTHTHSHTHTHTHTHTLTVSLSHTLSHSHTHSLTHSYTQNHTCKRKYMYRKMQGNYTIDLKMHRAYHLLMVFAVHFVLHNTRQFLTSRGIDFVNVFLSSLLFILWIKETPFFYLFNEIKTALLCWGASHLRYVRILIWHILTGQFLACRNFDWVFAGMHWLCGVFAHFDFPVRFRDEKRWSWVVFFRLDSVCYWVCKVISGFCLRKMKQNNNRIQALVFAYIPVLCELV